MVGTAFEGNVDGEVSVAAPSSSDVSDGFSEFKHDLPGVVPTFSESIDELGDYFMVSVFVDPTTESCFVRPRLHVTKDGNRKPGCLVFGQSPGNG